MVLTKVLYLYLLLLYTFTAESRPPVKHDSILSLHHASSKSRGSLSDSPAHSSLPSSSSSDDEDDSDSDINVTNDTEDVPTEIETKTTETTTTGVGENSVTTGIIVSASTTAHEDAGGCVPLTCGNGNIGDRCGVIPNGCGGTINCGFCDTSNGKTNNMCVDGTCSCTPNEGCTGKVYGLCGGPDGCGVAQCCPSGSACLEDYCAVIYTQNEPPTFIPGEESEYQTKTHSTPRTILAYLSLAALPIMVLLFGLLLFTKCKAHDIEKDPLLG